MAASQWDRNRCWHSSERPDLWRGALGTSEEAAEIPVAAPAYGALLICSYPGQQRQRSRDLRELGYVPSGD